MIIKDQFGTKVKIHQCKDGKIRIPIGERSITLSREDALTFTLNELGDFDTELFNKAYPEKSIKERQSDCNHDNLIKEVTNKCQECGYISSSWIQN
jgi:hypothetical protein